MDKTAKVSVSPFLLPKHPQTGHEYAFSSLTRKILKSHIFKTTVLIPTKFCTAIKTINYASWMVQTRVKQIQDGGRPLS